MEIRLCIFCNQELNNNNKSTEHLIPKCMGGKLKSELIICKKCNNKFGTEFDEALIERYALIIHPIRLFNPKLKIKDVIVELNRVKYLLTTDGINLKDPYQSDESKGFLGMVFPSTESLRKHLIRKKRKDPTIDVQETIKAAKQEKFEIKEHFNFKIKNITNEVYRSCGKICYELLFYIKNDYEPSSDLFVKFVMGALKSSDFPICIWYADFTLVPNKKESIYHIIVIEGRSEEHILIGYLNVFDCLPTLMILDSDYTGPTFSKGYYQDLLDNTHGFFTPSCAIPLTREMVIDLVSNFNPLEIMGDYSRSVFDTLDKSRLYPIKRELEHFVEKLPSKINSSNVDLLAKIYEEITLILDKYGVFLVIKDRLEEVEEDFEDITYLTKISILVDFLLFYFVRSRIGFEVFERLSQIIQ